MRIASYNIMSGGFNAYDYEAPKPERLDLLRDAIAALSAEVIGLVDTFRWDDIFRPEDIRNLFNYKYVYCINLNDMRLKATGHNNGLTLMSNIPMTCRTIRIETRDAIEAILQFRNRRITLFLIYLDDLSEDIRLVQIKEIIKKARDSPNDVILMGDLNSLKRNELDELEKPLQEFYRDNQATERVLRPVIEDMKKGEVVEALEKAGFKDPGENSYPTVPTKLFPAITSRPFLRLDYCFHSPSLTVRSLPLGDDRMFQMVSDHLPVLCEIDGK